MPELIDKQKAQTEIALIAKHLARSDAQKAIIGRIIFMIDQMPTTEPEVRHGRWDDSADGITPYCTVCGRTHRCFNRTPNFCPNCGARMDQEVQE